ncbi:class II 3-deoxy-7-phosphoheptulonate synthase [Robiginitomaculum antarcticum]|uniref:class II 3-deoxy-7-phosphoheptulonate synthase n=1 Tax=Robiginitomaculum antarcticum TaxID=437507 RepID=UPI000381675C|nr:3-deoxy-7-phosphoheptulonate synthase class II [Robiginitomaculum antarcticum]
MTKWTPSNWRKLPAKHIPTDYPDLDKLAEIEATLSGYPPLVFAGEARRLKQRLGAVARGESFLLQGGDCAESFREFHPDNLRDMFRVLMQMAVVLTYGAGKPVVKVGRIAGQFGKPRSSAVEVRDGVELPSYRGDNINGMDFNEKSRIPNPKRLLKAYGQSASTLNLLRAFSTGGYADLRNIHDWTLGFVAGSEQTRKYQEVCDKISDAMEFMQACGVTAETTPQMSSTELYTSHEGLLLGYEQAMTRIDSTSGRWYDTSAHLLWIGDRTRQLDGAHVDFMSGIENPIAMKCGPTMEPDDLLRLCDKLNPANEAGRLTLICRFGHDKVGQHLPNLARAIERAGKTVVWSCDPMHGNTLKTASGYKTRPFDRIMGEVKSFMDVLHSENLWPGGVHFEMTGQNVTECIGGAIAVREEDLSSRYHTHCDPRLNADQALELAFLISEQLRSYRVANSARLAS